MKTFKEFITAYSSHVRGIKLGQGMQKSMRDTLASYADMHEAIERPRTSFAASFLERLDLRIFQAGFATLLVLIGAGGVAYASSDALPGDTLYAVKVAVVEPIESSMLKDPKSRATWNAILAERRLAEAASLASGGRLTEVARADLEERFEVHTERSKSAADEVRDQGSLTEALAMHSDLEARLAAHVDIFSYLAEADETMEARKFLAKIADKRNLIAAERQKTEAQVTGRPLAYGDQQVTAAEKATEKAAKVAQRGEGAGQGSVDARITAARAAISSARNSVANDEGGTAFVSTQAAARLTHEASILSKALALIGTGTTTATTTEESATSTEEEPEEADAEDAPSQNDAPSRESQSSSPAPSVRDTVRSTVKSVLGL